MEKRELFRILCKSAREQVILLANGIKDKHVITVVRKPAKTLVLMKVREPVAQSEFYLGEVLACEAMVRIGESQGMALTIGDDFEKVLSMAIVDAACNAAVPELGWIGARLSGLQAVVDREERIAFARNHKSKVQFNVMEGQ